MAKQILFSQDEAASPSVQWTVGNRRTEAADSAKIFLSAVEAARAPHYSTTNLIGR